MQSVPLPTTLVVRWDSTFLSESSWSLKPPPLLRPMTPKRWNSQNSFTSILLRPTKYFLPSFTFTANQQVKGRNHSVVFSSGLSTDAELISTSVMAPFQQFILLRKKRVLVLACLPARECLHIFKQKTGQWQPRVSRRMRQNKTLNPFYPQCQNVFQVM